VFSHNLFLKKKFFQSKTNNNIEEISMQRKDRSVWVIAVGVLLVLISATALMFVTPASAQCGSQASSCKNCHEVQGEMSVNSDGTSWHQSHAFGDFCYICHAGNQQATDKVAAHEGMVPPLSDAKASCQQCHVADLDERAQVYATILGVEVGAGGGSAPEATSSTTETGSQAAPVVSAVSAPIITEIDVNDPNLIDYVQRYNEIVLGEKPVNWGNNILWLLSALVIVGGASFITINEVSKALNKKAIEGVYAPDVVEMLPQLEGLKPKTRKALKSVLESSKADKAVELMSVVASEEKTEK